MIKANIYIDSPVHYNRFGERIQDWDSYGKKHAHRTTHEKKLAMEIYASDEKEVLRRADYLFDAYTIELVELV